MFDFILTKIFRVLGKFRNEIYEIEELLFDDKEDDLLQEILTIRKNLTNFSSIIYPLEQFIIDLQTKYTKFIDNKGVEKLDDSLDKVKKMLNNLVNSKDQIILLHEINETLLARSTNKTIKAMTALNIIIFVPSLITGFFGMNAFFGWFPEATNYTPLAIIIGLITMSTLGTYAYFRAKRLL
jgi:magnesium transporter